MLNKEKLIHLYIDKKNSLTEIAEIEGMSVSGVRYWMSKYGIKSRSRSDAVYVKKNKEGDPFSVIKPVNVNEAFLYGMGVGLYWGEGTKANRHSVRLGNTDPSLVQIFIEFLEVCCGIDKKRLRFGLQIFGDMDEGKALCFWLESLRVSKDQFQKVVITPHRGVGTYRKKTKNGVLTVYFHNVKLRNKLCSIIEVLHQRSLAIVCESRRNKKGGFAQALGYVD